MDIALNILLQDLVCQNGLESKVQVLDFSMHQYFNNHKTLRHNPFTRPTSQSYKLMQWNLKRATLVFIVHWCCQQSVHMWQLATYYQHTSTFYNNMFTCFMIMHSGTVDTGKNKVMCSKRHCIMWSYGCPPCRDVHQWPCYFQEEVPQVYPAGLIHCMSCAGLSSTHCDRDGSATGHPQPAN